MSGRKPSTTINLPECRDQYLDELRRGAKRWQAADAIGCNTKAAQRYIRDHPEFAAKVGLAEAGQPTAPELPPDVEPAPVAIARVVHEAEPVDSAPCEGDPFDAPPLRPAKMRGGPTRETFESRLAEVIDDPESKHWGKAADICARYFYGPEMLRALRLAEREAEHVPGDKPQKILVIRVPDNGTRGAAK